MLEGAYLRKEIDQIMIRRPFKDIMSQTILSPDTLAFQQPSV